MEIEPETVQCAHEEFVKEFEPENASFGDRVNQALREQRRSKVWLAHRLNISKQNLNYLLRHSYRHKHIEAISEALSLKKTWLLYGKGTKHLDTPLGHRKIPVLPMLINQANEYEHADGDTTTLIVGRHLDPACFAVQLTNTSMAPYFKKDSFLIFDPNRQAENTDYVCLCLKNKPGLLFRQVHMDTGDIYFKACNQMYRTIHNEPYFINGVLVEAISRF